MTLYILSRFLFCLKKSEIFSYPEMNESDFIPRKGLKLADRLEVKIFDDVRLF